MNIPALSALPKSLTLSLAGYSFSPSMVQAGAIIFLVFLLVLMMAQVRRHLMDWSMKGAVFGIFIGFLLALLFEGFMVIGGKTAVTELLGWKNAPAPLLGLLDGGRGKLINVLGIQDQIPASFARENPTVQDALTIFQGLDPTEIKKARSVICKP